MYNSKFKATALVSWRDPIALAVRRSNFDNLDIDYCDEGKPIDDGDCYWLIGPCCIPDFVQYTDNALLEVPWIAYTDTAIAIVRVSLR